METLPSSPLAAFCSHGNDYASFLTDSIAIKSDVESMLRRLNVSDDVRAQISDILERPDYASGIRFESESGHQATPNRTVFFASIPISYIDKGKPTAQELLSQNPKRSTYFHFGADATSAWRAP